jgi:hypothetical protein
MLEKYTLREDGRGGGGGMVRGFDFAGSPNVAKIHTVVTCWWQASCPRFRIARSAMCRGGRRSRQWRPTFPGINRCSDTHYNNTRHAYHAGHATTTFTHEHIHTTFTPRAHYSREFRSNVAGGLRGPEDRPKTPRLSPPLPQAAWPHTVTLKHAPGASCWPRRTRS